MTRQPKLNVGDRVRIEGRSETGVVVSPGKPFRATFQYQVVIEGDPNWTYLPEDELELIESSRDSPAAWLLDQPLVDAATFAEYYTMLKLNSRLSDHLYSYLASRTIFRVYQFKPVLKLLSSPVQSLLIADEVGLGKTIEAGLIWTELDARMSLDRVLVVCPAGLRSKWRLEMERRFDREVAVWERSSDVRAWLDRYAQLGDGVRAGVVAGLESLRSRSTLGMLRDVAPTFDLVIVDEAHHMRNRGTLSFELGEFLSEASDYRVFLTATPVNLGTPDLFNLLSLLSPEEFDEDAVFDQLVEPNRHINAALRHLRMAFPPDNRAVRTALVEVERTTQAARFTRNPLYEDLKERLTGPIDTRADVVDLQRRIGDLNTLGQIYTRTRKRDLAEKFAVRRARTLEVEWSDPEWAVYDAATRFVLSRFRRLREQGAPIGFIAITPQRQAASCIQVMRDYLVDTIERRRLEVDFEEGEEDDLGEEATDDAFTIRDPELESLTAAIDAARGLGDIDSKFERFAQELAKIRAEEPSAQLLVFSFFRRTLTYLEKRLAELGFDVERMDGGTKREERERLMQDFRDGRFNILLSSEIGAEGLDFEFCRYLVNYDLPWNPMRLEQRIGRLDRFGQQHESIVIVNFHIPGTIETDIFERLYNRIGIFEDSIGELEPILGEAVRELERRVLQADLDPEEERREADRIAQAIEAGKAQLAQFEETRAQLVGQDDYVIEQLDEIAEQRRYITPLELERLFRGFLVRDVGGRWTLREDERIDGLYYFQVGGRFGEQLRPYLRRQGTQALDLLTKLEGGTGFTVTFTPDVAYQRQVEFLSIRHPFIKSILAFYEDSGRVYRAGAITLAGSRSAEFVFFIFVLNASGLVPRETLLAVAVDVETFEVDEEASALVLPGLAADGLRGPETNPVMLPDRVDRAYAEAERYVFEAREALKADLVKTNQAIAVGRIESLRSSMTLRVSRLEEQLLTLREERVRRMREAQIRNIQNRVEAKIDEIQRQQVVTVDARPLAGGWLQTTA